MKECWGEYQLEKNQPHFWRLGTLELWLQHCGDDLLVAYDNNCPVSLDNQVAIGEHSEVSIEQQWKRWYLGKWDGVLRFSPVLPNYSTVAWFTPPLNLHNKKHTVFFTTVPLWLRVEVPSTSDPLLFEVPTFLLSKTWYGDNFSGEACYSLRTTPHHQLETLPETPFSAVCPISVFNDSGGSAEFERVLLRTASINIYQAESGRMWTNRIQTTLKKDDKTIHTSDNIKPPHYEPVNAQPVALAREPERSKIPKSIKNFKLFG